MLDAAMALMQRGETPSVSDVAAAAAVSRATAYRYFPSEAALVAATVDAAFRPIAAWRGQGSDPAARVAALIGFALPQLEEYEATHRAALRLALDQPSRRAAAPLAGGEPLARGEVRGLLAEALAPLQPRLRRPAFDKAVQSLSLVFGIEALVVLKDVWGLDRGGARRVMVSAAEAIVRAAAMEARMTARGRAASGSKKGGAARQVRRSGKETRKK